MTAAGNWRKSYNKTLAELTEARNANHAMQDRIMVALNPHALSEVDDDEEEDSLVEEEEEEEAPAEDNSPKPELCRCMRSHFLMSGRHLSMTAAGSHRREGTH